jgi:hypothetical protein
MEDPTEPVKRRAHADESGLGQKRSENKNGTSWKARLYGIASRLSHQLAGLWVQSSYSRIKTLKDDFPAFKGSLSKNFYPRMFLQSVSSRL